MDASLTTLRVLFSVDAVIASGDEKRNGWKRNKAIKAHVYRKSHKK
jgi:hypothetical protein